MPASSKYDLPSSGPSRLAYLNGSRGSYTATSLEKSGSFREGVENRTTSLLSGMSKPNMALPQRDMSTLKSLLSDLKLGVLDQKLAQFGEVKKSISNILGITSEDCLPTTFSIRALPSSSSEEIRRLKSNLGENSFKARDRAKALNEAISKIDKYFHSMSRKRSRVDISSSERPNAVLLGGITPRSGPQTHLSACCFEDGPKKLEEKVKSGVTSRRVRTARAGLQLDERPNGISRFSGLVQRDKEVSELINGGTTPLEDTGRPLLTGIDGWEKSKMKKKRSVIKSDTSANSASAGPLESDRGPKRGIQRRPISDARPRLNNTHGFRSGPVAAATGAGKTDSASQQNGPGMCLFHRNDQDSLSLPNDRRDHPVGLDKDGATLKAASKFKACEDNSVASLIATTQVNGSARGPRSNSGSLLKASPNIHQVMGSSDDWEHPQVVKKLNATDGAIKRKSSTSTCSPSPPVAQWCRQRPQKITRIARRSNLVPVVSKHDDIAASNVDNVANNNDGACTRHLSYNGPQQSKLKAQRIQTSGLSENESEAPDSEVKANKFSEIEDRVSQAIQKVATTVLPLEKNKMVVDEDFGDGFQKQGRSGRGFSPTRSGRPGATDKLENYQWRTRKNGFEKIGSKPGRPHVAHMRPRHSQNNGSTVFTGEPDDDDNELLVAVHAASGNACCSSSSEQKELSLWEQMEPFFHFVTAEDVAFLNQQIHLDGAAATTCFPVGQHSLKGDCNFLSLPSTPVLDNRRDSGIVSNELVLGECHWDSGICKTAEPVEPFLEQLVRGTGVPNGVSICQALLSAIIEEEEIVTLNYASRNGEERLFDDAYGICFGFDEELKSKGSDLSLLGTYQVPEKVSSNGYKINAGPGCLAELANDKMGTNGALIKPCVKGHTGGTFFCNQSMACVSKFQYNQMCTDDRILLELSGLGLYPEPLPDLAQSEEEEIGKGINLLEEQLHEQVTTKMSLLSKLENVVTEARQSQQRAIDHISLDKLIGEAYKKYMACWGPKAVCSKNVNEAMKHAALSYVRITLALYQKFELTGGSCFNERAFQNIFLSVSSCLSGAEEIVEDKEAANCLAFTLNSETVSTDHTSCFASQAVDRADILGKYSDASRSVNHLSEQMFHKEDLWANKVRRRELLLDDVASASTLRDPSNIGSYLLTGAKGKRSEREGKGKNRGAASRSGTVKNDQPALYIVKGERKNRTKVKQRAAHPSASVNSLLSKPTEVSSTIILSSAPKSQETVFGGNTKKDSPYLLSNNIGTEDVQNNTEAIDLSSLQIPELDGEFDGQGQDISSWLNIEDDGLQDHDFMGLDIPMDDLSDLNMII